MVSQCKARKRNGKRCPNPASASGYCFTHDPARSAERSAARKRGGFNRRTAARVSGAEAVQIKDIADVWQLENSPARGRVLLGAADTAMRALQVGELEERVKALETRLNSGNPTAQA